MLQQQQRDPQDPTSPVTRGGGAALRSPVKSEMPTSPPPPPLRPLIVLDLRPLDAFQRVRIAGSINLALPSLVVRRMRRAVATATTTTAAASSAASSSTFNPTPLTHLLTYVTTASSKRKFQDLLDSMPEDENATPATTKSPMDLWRADVVIVCDNLDAGSLPSGTTAVRPKATPSGRDVPETLAGAIAQACPRAKGSSTCGSVRVIDRDLTAWTRHPKYAKLVEQGAEEGEAVAAEGGVADAATAQAVGRLTLHSPERSARSDMPPPASTGARGSASASSLSPSAPPPSSSSASPPVSVSGAGPVAPAPSSMAPSPPTKKPGRPSLARLDTSEKVKTISPTQQPPQPRSAAGAATTTSSPLRVAVSGKNLLRDSSAQLTPASAVSAGSSLSLQNVANLQSKLPPSPASFSEMSLPFGAPSQQSANLRTYALQSPWSPAQADRELARRGSVPLQESHLADVSPVAPDQAPPITASAAVPSFDVSTVIPGFLFLGPDITTNDEMKELEAKGVKRILNCAAELADLGAAGTTAAGATAASATTASVAKQTPPPSPSPAVQLGNSIERYLKIPMWDNVEATGVQEDIEQACAFLDDARLHDAPVYVHCRAGKSRSVSIVMAYLIHAHRWTLKRSYDYVAEKRPDISPNIGFVSCLMAFEEMTLNRRGIAGVVGSPQQHHDKPSDGSGGGDDEDLLRQTRQSMPCINALIAGDNSGSGKSAAGGSLAEQNASSSDAPSTPVADAASRTHLPPPQFPPSHALPSGSTTQFNTEHRGRDGRYRTFRGPAVVHESSGGGSGDGAAGPPTPRTRTNGVGANVGVGANAGGPSNTYAPCRRATMAGLGSLLDRQDGAGGGTGRDEGGRPE